VEERDQPKIYTVAEARELLPRLRPLLIEIRDLRREIADHTATLREMTPNTKSNGHAPEVARLEGRISNCIDAVRERLDVFSDLDIEVKDLETGLVDFLSLREGRIVYLCWAVDEPTIAYWHELNSGYRGRQPLDE
jgi:hypothetical protein